MKYGQLAKKVANVVKDFLDVSTCNFIVTELAKGLQEAARLRLTHPWAVQDTDQFRSRILIIGLAHITTGHYQPILQLCHGDARVALVV